MLSTLLLVAISAPPDGLHEFVASGASDTLPHGHLTGLTDGNVELVTPAGTVQVQDLIALRRPGVALPPHPQRSFLLTTTGDRIPGNLLGGTGDRLRFQPSWGDSVWDVPIATVDVIWLTRPPSDTPPDPAKYTWLLDRSRRDVVRFPNGDTAHGTIDGFPTAETLRLKPQLTQARSLRLSEITAIAFNPGLARSRKPKGRYAHLVLRNGTRVDLTGLTLVGGTLKGTTLFGPIIEVPLADLVALDIIGGKGVSLGSLKPYATDQGGFLGVAWPWVPNRTVRGEPLRLLTPEGESTFDRGLGTHPRTRLVYNLAGKFRRFEALVGLDTVSSAQGKAVVRILLDGKEHSLPELLNLSAGPAVPVRVDITGVKELTLVVDFGPAGDVQSDVNWADAQLVE